MVKVDCKRKKRKTGISQIWQTLFWFLNVLPCTPTHVFQTAPGLLHHVCHGSTPPLNGYFSAYSISPPSTYIWQLTPHHIPRHPQPYTPMWYIGGETSFGPERRQDREKPGCLDYQILVPANPFARMTLPYS